MENAITWRELKNAYFDVIKQITDTSINREDISNYVMLAVGQPTHVFDSTHIIDHIEVRRAEEGETLQLLNDKQLTLTADDLVIAECDKKDMVMAFTGMRLFHH